MIDSYGIALNLLDHGVQPVPCRPRSKAPKHDEWPTIRYTVDSAKHEFRDGDNVGAVLGEPSGWLVDVDIDNAGALDMAHKLLRGTACFGRMSKPRSHYLFKCVGAKTRTWVTPDGKHAVQLRGHTNQDKPGLQTIMPGSVHQETGEAIRWEDGTSLNDVRDIEPHELTHLLDRIASAVDARPQSKPSPRPRSFVDIPPMDIRGTPYARTAMSEELGLLRSTAEGGRNHQLNRSAFALFQLAHAGELDMAEVERELHAAAMSTGLPESEIRATMRSASEAAYRLPRQPRAEAAPRMASVSAPPPVADIAPGWVDEMLDDIASTQGREAGGIVIPGFPLLSGALFGLRGNCLLTGPSGMGKTTLVNTMAVNLALGRSWLNTDEPSRAPVRVVYMTAEMSRADIALSMLSMLSGAKVRTLLTGEALGELGDGVDAGRLMLTGGTRARVAEAIATLRELERGTLSIVEAQPLMRGWRRDEHALVGLEAAVRELVPTGPCVVIVDTLAHLNPPPADGEKHRSELDQDRDIVDGLIQWQRALTPGSAIMAVHEESKAATGTGDGHAVRGSSRYMYATGQRLTMVSADSEDGTRKLGLRTGPAEDGVAEVDLMIPKARRGGHSHTTVALHFEYETNAMREVGSFTLADRRQARAERREEKKGGKK